MNGDVYSCRKDERKNCIVSRYYRQDENAKNKKIKIDEVLDMILHKKAFKNSPANIFNLVEIENDSFKIKNVRSFTIPPEPEYRGEESVSRQRTGQIDLKVKIKEIVKGLIVGYNLDDVWLDICNLQRSLKQNDDSNYEPLIILLKIFTIMKITKECTQENRSGFGGRYGGIFPVLMGKEPYQIKGEMINHAKRSFLKELKEYYNVENTNELINNIKNDKKLKKFFSNAKIIEVFCETVKEVDKIKIGGKYGIIES